MAPQDPDRLRADARQNREHLLEVAYDAFSRSSTVSLNAIAKQAGVGIGTLYRHFPTREALVLAIYRQEVQHLVDAAPALLAAEPPLVALRSWMDRLGEYGMTKVGMAEALASLATSHDALASETYGPVIDALSLLLQANQDAGTIRAGVDPDDVLLMLGFLWRIDPQSDWRSQAGRMLDLLVDGLRAGADS